MGVPAQPHLDDVIEDDADPSVAIPGEPKSESEALGSLMAMSVPDAVVAAWLAEVRAAVERERQAAELYETSRRRWPWWRRFWRRSR